MENELDYALDRSFKRAGKYALIFVLVIVTLTVIAIV